MPENYLQLQGEEPQVYVDGDENENGSDDVSTPQNEENVDMAPRPDSAPLGNTSPQSLEVASYSSTDYEVQQMTTEQNMPTGGN